MICELCKHDNPQENRFCGMCGMPLETAVFKSKSEPAYTARGDSSQSPAGGESTGSQGPNLPFETTAQSRPTRKPPEPIRPFWERHPVTPVVDEEPTPPLFNATAFEQPRRSASAPRSTAGSILGLGRQDVREAEGRTTTEVSKPSSISGPSFLGLGTEPDTSPNYLLEDEEPSSHWVGYTVAVVLILVATLAALQWHTEVKSQAQKVWARLQTSSPPAKTQETAAPTPGGTTVSEPSSQPPNATSPQTAPSPSGNSSGNTSAAAKEPSNDASQTTPPAAASPETGANDAGKPSDAIAEGKAAGGKNVATHSEKSEEIRSAATAAFPEPRTRAARQEQRRVATPAEDDSMLLLAQKYLQGRGVPRDCGRGLSYLKEAVRRPSAHARSQMGALYATGTCVPQSRVEAYRWFSSALEIDPRNPWLARERDTLYGEMTSFERQQVNR